MQELLKFLKTSVTEYQACNNISKMLEKANFTKLNNDQDWQLENGGCYYLTIDESALIAFKIGQKFNSCGFNIVASHLDSPNLKIKQNGIVLNNNYTMINAEVYGGPILESWRDRSLSIGGRVIVKDGDKLVSKLVNIDRDLLVIPRPAIHLHKANMENLEKELVPLASLSPYEDINSLLENLTKFKKEDIYGFDLATYVREEPKIIGVKGELFMSPRIDNLTSAYTSLKAFLASKPTDKTNVYVAFNNEEVGSSTKQGALSTNLADILRRVCANEENYQKTIANSFMVSADNAHAYHPNYPELSDATNKVYMNSGIVIKHNANLKYATDGKSNAIFSMICEKANVPVQHYSNKTGQPGGSTLGSLSQTKVSIPTVDIGLAQLAMHSAVEVAGTQDITYMVQGILAFYNSNIRFKNSEIMI